jgi:nucleoside-diphosphate-sugar epimerase
MASGVSGKRVVVTGASGLMGFPIAMALARDNEVTAVARFGGAGQDAKALQEAGARVVTFDLADPDLSPLPNDADLVFHFGAMTAFPRSPADRELQMDINVGATGRLALRYRECTAFVHASASVYQFHGERPLREDDPPGLITGLENYCASKVSAEQLLRFLSQEHRIPTVMLRISSCYGPRGGSIPGRIFRVLAGEPVMIYAGVPNRYRPMYETDYVEKAIASVAIAAVPAETINFAGSETCTIEEYCAIAGEIGGQEPILQESPEAIYPIWPDVSKMERLLGPTKVTPREGVRLVIESGSGYGGRYAGWQEPSETS